MDDRVWPRLCRAVAGILLVAEGGLLAAGTPSDGSGLEPLLAALLAAVTDHAPDTPPEAVAATVREWFPEAVLVTFGRISLSGVPGYDVLLRQADRDASMAVAADGSVGRIQLQARLADLPADEQARLAVAIRQGTVFGIDLHVRLGIAREGTFARADEPTAFYAVRYQRGTRTRVANLPVPPERVQAVLSQCGLAFAARPR